MRLAAKLASLYGKYLLYRPEKIVAWESRDDKRDWQGELWQLGLPTLPPNLSIDSEPDPPTFTVCVYRGPASVESPEKVSTTLPPNKRSKGDIGLWPGRISVFGVSSLPPVYLDLLEAVSYERPVHIFLLQPTDLYWADLKSKKSIAKASAQTSLRRRFTFLRPT